MDLVPKSQPGAPEFDAVLRKRLAERLAALGPGYVPRTRNLRPDGTPLYTNRLLLTSSPYLQQHAHNPVNWYPWGDEAFAAARRLKRPVLVSIGYSTCHWCHVMEEESFDDPETAAYLNAHFIAIKVDREVRPDVDNVYMAAVHALNQRGGWPLNVFLTPDRKPFFGGTYFPRKRSGGRPSFREILESISSEYDENSEKIVDRAEHITEQIERDLEGSRAAASRELTKEALAQPASYYARATDRTWGGVGTRPKFPSSLPVRLLLRHHRSTGDKDSLAIATLSLEKMAAGGLRDHVGGGFHRYSTDQIWLVPHFEKMLYDNALLAQDYLEAWQVTGRQDFADICRETLDYVAREMTAPGGGFYSATDADSRNPEGESEEGWFFTWTPEEIEAALCPERTRELSAYYGVTAGGNFEHRNILNTRRKLETVAAELGLPPANLEASLARSRVLLYEVRSRRPPPLRDDKVLVSWNGLMISAFARAGFSFDDARYTEIARKAASFMLGEMREDGRLMRVYKDGEAAGPAFLEDYAFFIKGLLDLYEAEPDPRWLEGAISLQSVLDSHYRDDLGGGYFKTADDGEALLVREKPGHDGAVPSGNSIAALNLLRLYEFTTNPHYAEGADMLFSAFYEDLSRGATGLSEMLIALDYQLDKPMEILIVAPSPDTDRSAMLAPLRDYFLSNRIVISVSEGEELAAHARLSPLLKQKRALGGKITAYVCEDRVCAYPTSSPEEFAKQLRRVRKPGR